MSFQLFHMVFVGWFAHLAWKCRRSHFLLIFLLMVLTVETEIAETVATRCSGPSTESHAPHQLMQVARWSVTCRCTQRSIHSWPEKKTITMLKSLSSAERRLQFPSCVPKRSSLINRPAADLWKRKQDLYWMTFCSGPPSPWAFESFIEQRRRRRKTNQLTNQSTYQPTG